MTSFVFLFISVVFSNRCTVDIQNTYDLEEFEDIMMHVSISPKENYPIVRNDYNNAEGGWGEEEVHGDNPVGQGQQFELTILAQEDRYLIAFNGQHFCEFQQRSPMGNGQFLAIRGECVIYEVQINQQ